MLQKGCLFLLIVMFCGSFFFHLQTCTGVERGGNARVHTALSLIHTLQLTGHHCSGDARAAAGEESASAGQRRWEQPRGDEDLASCFHVLCLKGFTLASSIPLGATEQPCGHSSEAQVGAVDPNAWEALNW